jgi:hypothetical protein
MTTAAMRYAIAGGLFAALVLTATSTAIGQVRPAAETGSRLAQFCIPPEGPDAHKYYCRNAGG